MNKDARIHIAGHLGLVGGAITRKLQAEGYGNLLLRSIDELDFTDRAATNRFYEAERPEYVIVAAAKVGGILANDTYTGDFIRENLLIQTHLIDAAYRNGAKKLLFLGSSCIYPRLAQQPIKEEYLLTGHLEPTNEAYAIAKIAGIKMCQAYRKQYGFNAISAMPTNLYGPGDNFNLETSHVLPAMVRRFHEAKVAGKNEVVIWGTGKPKREFLYVDDLADAALFLMLTYNESEWVNVGTGEDVTIGDLAELVKSVVGFEGEIKNDLEKPDGMPRKLLDVSKINGIGWKAKTSLRDGITATYEWYLANKT